MGIFHKFRYFNRTLALSCVLIAVSTFNYGFDNQAFASTQAMDAFQRRFGSYNPNTREYFLEPSWLSLFSSLNYIGLAAGESLPNIPLPMTILLMHSVPRRLHWKSDIFSMGPKVVHVCHELLCSHLCHYFCHLP